MPANSEHTDVLIWRIPGLPVQAWKLFTSGENEKSDLRVTVGPFYAPPVTYRAEGPFEPEEVFGLVNVDRLNELPKADSTDRESHIARVERTIQTIREQHLRKVVIARREQLERSIDPKSIFQNLCNIYPDAIVYVLHVNHELWMGATPETLLTADEHSIYTMALAGTRWPDGPDFTEKEFDEQRAVTESIENVLLELGSSKVIGKGPTPIKAGPVEHLITRIEASLPASGRASDWAKALHPTPAVSGSPKKEALDLILSEEDFDRSLYAGYIGWESSENARFYVNLRCMQVGKSRINLFAGGGITALSNAEAEWNETENKLKTLKAVIFPT